MSLQQQAFNVIMTLLGLTLLGLVIYHLTPVLKPFLIAAALAYLADPLVERLCSRKIKISRTVAVSAVFILVLIILFLAVFWLVPALQRQFTILMSKLPLIVDWIQNQLLPLLEANGLASSDLGIDALKAQLLKHQEQATQAAKWMWLTLFHSGTLIFAWMMNLLIVLVAGFYFLRDWPRVVSAIKSLIPPSVAPRVLVLAKKCDVVLATFVRGQLTMMVVLGTLYGAGLALIGVNFSLLLGMTAGILSIVPYLGSIVGLGAALIVAYLQFHDIVHLLWVLGVFGVGHLLEMMVLAPMLIGDKLGLHPVVVIFAVLAGGHLLGLVGVILALPLTAILVVLSRELLHHWYDVPPVMDAPTIGEME